MTPLLRHVRLLILALAALFALAACAPGEEPQTEPTPQPTPDATETPEETTEAELSAEELRLTLEQQLGAHALLAIDAMRNGLTGAEEFEASAATLDANTQDLTESIGLVYGDEGASAFQQMWEDHIGFFVQYTQGLAADDQTKQDEALAQLEQYRDDFSAFLDEASEGNLPAGPVSDSLQMHVDQLVSQIDAYDAQDFATAFDVEREAYGHMFETAQVLAEGISTQFPDRFPSGGEHVSLATHTGVAVAQTEGEPIPATDLQSLLGQQLGQHANAAIVAMRRGFNGAPDFEQAAAALDANTQDLTSSIELVYGSEGAQAFQQMWEDHIGFFVQYTQGLAGDDQAMQDEALARLEQYRQDFSAFIDEASEGNIPGDAVAESLQTHVDQLVTQIDAYAEGDFESAFSEGYEAYQHMFETAGAFATGLSEQFPDRFPGTTSGARHSS
ncbi:MAG TPA: hypothetical protein VM324_15690 [Egibacteraceae bacterium]|jgi:cytochrome c556|nr:hypothetical protein [Egibacteraceae bacterium]